MSDLITRLQAGFPATVPERLGVAVSGGGDSVALLHLLSRMPDAPDLHAVTVDHGLRPEAAQEARDVAALCARLDVPHTTLHWPEGPAGGNLQAAARAARYRLMAEWGKAQGLGAIALGHTQDDQAETLVMRLARGAGVTGLTAMQPERMAQGITWLRPMLGLSRAELRGYLDTQGLIWADDPSNEDPRFARIRTRAALDALAEAGVTRSVLAEVAQNMARAEAALATQTRTAAARLGRVHAGDILLDRAALSAEPQEIARRLLIRALACVAGPGYAPRAAPLMAALGGALEGRSSALHGCLILSKPDHLRITRELRAVRDLREAGPVWDRWHLSGLGKNDSIAALGEAGLARCPNRRDTGAPHVSLMASPGVWRQGVLVAAPVAGWPQGITATPRFAVEWLTLA